MRNKYSAAFDEIFQQFTGPKFSLVLWNGERYEYGEGEKESFALHIKNSRVFKRLLLEGAIGFGESYMNGSLSIEGDLEAYLRLRHEFKKIKPSVRLVYAKLMAHVTSPRRTKDQIQHHYDLGNDFFSLFLDHETMSYSGAKFISDSETLGEAQKNKLDLVCKWLDLKKDSRILDLGSGWGGFAAHAAREHAWYIEGTTLSQEQLQYSDTLIERAGLEDRGSISFQDFLHDLPKSTYDGVVMLESFEHVGKENLHSFMKSVGHNVSSGAPMYMQFTGRYKEKKVDPWTLKYVFPGGHLPSKREFEEAIVGTGLVIERFEDDTEDYKKTMRMWVDAIEAHQADIEEMYGQDFFRLWKLWTHGAYVNFDIGDMSLFRVLLRKSDTIN